MRVVCFGTDFHPRTLGRPGIEYVKLRKRDNYAYWHAFVHEWMKGTSFIGIEHDIGITPEQIRSLRYCDHDWCVYEYLLWDPGARGLDYSKPMTTHAMGVGKYSSRLIRRGALIYPESWQHMHFGPHSMRGKNKPPYWGNMDGVLYEMLVQPPFNATPHVHEGLVEHYRLRTDVNDVSARVEVS